MHGQKKTSKIKKLDFSNFLSLTLHTTQHTHHMLPQYCVNSNDDFTDCIYKKVTLTNLSIDFLKMVRTERNM